MLLLVWTEVWQKGSRLQTGHDRPGWSVGWREGERSLFCVRFFWLWGRDPAHCSAGEWGREVGVLTLKVQEVTWSLGPRNRDSPGAGIRQEEMRWALYSVLLASAYASVG